MPRKANKPAITDSSEVSQAVTEVIHQGNNEIAEHSANILALYGDGEAFFDLFRFEDKARERMEAGAKAMIDAGRYLVVIREHIAHGDWLDSLSRMQINPRAAQKMMQAAVKYLSSPGSKKVLETAGSKTKLLELVVLDEEELQQLGDGGTVAGITLDDVDRMSCTDLRKALREARQDAEAQREVAATKNQKIDDLATQLQKSKKQMKAMPVDEQMEALRLEATQFAFAAEAAVRGELAGAVTALLEFESKSGINQGAFLSGLVGQLERAVNDVRFEYGIAQHPDSDAVPAWQRDDADDVIEATLAGKTE